MKRTIALLLVLVTVALTLSACATPEQPDDNGDTTTTTVGGEVVTDVTVTTAPYPSQNPELNFGGKTINFLSRAHEWFADEIDADAMNGEIVNDAVFVRNAAVEKNLGVEIVNTLLQGDQYAISNEIKKLHDVQDDTYDLFANSTYSTIMYTEQGYYADLLNCEYLELEQPWFSQRFNDVASVGQAQYLATGSLALAMYRLIFATFINTQIMDSILIESVDLYDVVMNGEWTIDYQNELAAKIYQDADGDGKKNDQDIYGFVTNSNMLGVDPYWSSLDLKILAKNNDNYYDVVLDIDRISAAVDKINDLIHDCPGTYAYKHVSGNEDTQISIRKKFAADGAAMATLRIIECESAELRENYNYGIIPMPKFSKKQSEYLSFAHDQITSFGIPSTVTNDEDRFQRAGAVLNEMSRQSIITVQPAYYELALKSKYLNDEKSWKMLDMIVEGLYLDGGILYTKKFESVHQMMRTFIGNNSNTVSSTLGTKIPHLEKVLNEYMDEIKALQTAAS